MTTFSKVQSASNFADPAAVTLGAAPTEGNLLIGVLSQRAGTAHADHVLEDTEGGWTKIADASNDQELADANARQSCSVWWKPVTASTPDTFSGDDGTTNSKRLTIIEYAPDGAYTFGVAGAKSANSGTGSSAPLGSGNTGSIASSDLLLIGGGCWRQEGIIPGIGPLASPLVSGSVGAIGASNGIAHFIDFAAAGQASGVKSTSLSWSGSGHEAICWLAAFEDTGGGGTPVGLAAEADAALAVTAARRLAVGLAAETDSPLAATIARARAAGLAAETNSPLAATIARALAAGLAAETDSALAATIARVRAVGVSAESDAALALGTQLVVALGLAGETDAALAATIARARALGLAAETGAALAIAARRAVALGLAADSESALALVIAALALDPPLTAGIADPGRTASVTDPGCTATLN